MRERNLRIPGNEIFIARDRISEIREIELFN